MSDDKPIHRRAFFRRGLGELLKPLADALAPIERTLDELQKLDRLGVAPAQPSPLVLRPPGALPDKDFRAVCSRGGECVRVCPAQAIRIDPTGRIGNGAPYIDATHMPCIVCSGLQCMHVCPSGALKALPLPDIDMGTAVWQEHLCLRSDGQNNCTICIDQCPLGQTAIELIDGQVRVNPHGCIGCGVCEHYCPTTPKSIVVIPVSARQH
jgi:MauM/NapG family ferredoxin protein